MLSGLGLDCDPKFSCFDGMPSLKISLLVISDYLSLAISTHCIPFSHNDVILINSL